MSTATNYLTDNVAGLTVSVQGETTTGGVVSNFKDALGPIVALLIADKDPTDSTVQQLKQTFPNTNSLTTDLSPDSLNKIAPLIQESIDNLIQLAKNGVSVKTDPTDPNSPAVNYYLTNEMADSLNQLLGSFKIAGIGIDTSTTPPNVTISGDALRRWLDLSSITSIVDDVVKESAASTVSATTSFQASVELDYVKGANDLISGKLNNLEGALSTTQSALSVLRDVQDLHNSVKPTPLPAYGPEPSQSDLDLYAKGNDRNNFYTKVWYDAQSKQTFAPIPLNMSTPAFDKSNAIGTQIASINKQISILQSELNTQKSKQSSAQKKVNANSTDQNAKDNLKQANSAIDQINAEIAALQQQLVPLNDQLAQLAPAVQQEISDGSNSLFARYDTVLQELNDQIAALEKQFPKTPAKNPDGTIMKDNNGNIIYNPDPDLLVELRKVRDDMSTNDDHNKPLWFVDGYGASGSSQNSGTIQQNISFAMSAAESLNDTQKTDVRRYMFVFEEYYKSASSILDKMSQLMEKMARASAKG